MTPAPHTSSPSARDTTSLRARLAAALREFWHVMRAAHHERVPH